MYNFALVRVAGYSICYIIVRQVTQALFTVVGEEVELVLPVQALLTDALLNWSHMTSWSHTISLAAHRQNLHRKN